MSEQVKITINANSLNKKIKPMHAINNGPILSANDRMFHYIKEAGIPYSRLHDTGGDYGGGCFVDIANVFRDFNADPADPDNYDFAFTDWLIKTLHDCGTQAFYRLGATIENYHKIRAYNIFPPADNYKWAQICEHIIRHYNEGWAEGYYFNLTYWEIWNEPDNEPNPEDNPMWKGNMQQYLELYHIASTHLKKCFPNLMIGGYASCGFYDILNKNPSETAHVGTRIGYFVEFFQEFLKYAQKHELPLDFFSWHSYSGIYENIQYAEYVRKQLDAHGFTQTLSILNEWNPGIEHRGKLTDASNIAAMMCALQYSPLDMLMYYDGQVNSSYGGMFDPISKTPFKAYYVFKAFNELYKLGTAAEVDCTSSSCHACAAINAKGCKGSLDCLCNQDNYSVLIANTTDNYLDLSITTNTQDIKVKSLRMIDTQNNLDFIAVDSDIIKLPPRAVALALCAHGV